MSRRIVVNSDTVVKSAGCKGCKPAPWESEVKCTGVNCSKNLAHLSRKWDRDLQVEARKDGYATIGEIRTMESRIEAAELALDAGHLVQDDFDLLVGQLENAKLSVPTWRTAKCLMPRWSAIAEKNAPDLHSISLVALESASAHMSAFVKRCEMLRKEQHPGATARCARIKAGLEKGNFAAIWARAKAAAAVYQARKVLAKSSIQPLKAAIYGAKAQADREYAAGYEVVKGEQEEGAYKYPEIAQQLEAADLKEMVRKAVPAEVLRERAATLTLITRLDGYDFTRDYPVPDVVEEELVAY